MITHKPQPTFKPSLKDRLSKVAASASVDMNPLSRKKFTPPPPKEEDIPDMRDVIGSTADQSSLIRLVGEHAAIGQQERLLKGQKEPLTDRIKDILGRNKATKLKVDTYRVNYYSAPRTSIKKELLLEAGVAPDIIAACTVSTETYTLRVTEIKEGEEE